MSTHLDFGWCDGPRHHSVAFHSALSNFAILLPLKVHVPCGELGTLPFKTPNVLFSENSLFISEAAFGCYSRFPEPSRASQSSWGRQVLPSPPGPYLGQEQRTFEVSFLVGPRPPGFQLKTCPQPIPTHPQPHNLNLTTLKNQSPLDVAFLLPF